MINHSVRVFRSDEGLRREDQLAWKLAQVAIDPIEVTGEVTEMVINRIIDSASVAAGSLRRSPIVSARSQATAHAVSARTSVGTPAARGGSTVFGLEPDVRVSPEWAV